MARAKQAFFAVASEIPRDGFGLVRFRRTDVKSRQLVELSPSRIADYWQTRNWYARSPSHAFSDDLPFAVDIPRIRSLMQCIGAGTSLPPVELFCGVDKDSESICFPDGRHRITLLHVAGYSSIFAEVPTEDVAVIVDTLGADVPDARLRLAGRASPRKVVSSGARP